MLCQKLWRWTKEKRMIIMTSNSKFFTVFFSLKRNTIRWFGIIIFIAKKKLLPCFVQCVKESWFSVWIKIIQFKVINIYSHKENFLNKNKVRFEMVFSFYDLSSFLFYDFYLFISSHHNDIPQSIFVVLYDFSPLKFLVGRIRAKKFF